MTQHSSSEDVDLGYLLKKSNDIFKSIARGILMVLDFFKRFFIVVIILILLGVGYGLYKDYNAVKSYNNELLVIPNFGSVDYLYDKIDALNSKIVSRDSIFLKQVLGSNYSQINVIEIEPIVDLYNFISESRQNIDILKIISQNQDFSEYVENMATSKYYKYHRMQISIKGKESSEKIIEDLFKYFNNNEHFQTYQKIYKQTKDIEVQQHFVMIAQLDSLIKANYTVQKQGSSVTVSNNADQYNLVEKKRQIIDNLQRLQIQQNDYSVPIKRVSANYNMEPERLLDISNMVKYPLLLIISFSLIFLVLFIFKSLKKYADAE